MEAIGFLEQTISDYRLHITHSTKITGAEFLNELAAGRLYEWLSSMNVSSQTKLTRLKYLKAFLGRCFDRSWVQPHFWQAIKIKVDRAAKSDAAAKDIPILLHLLDLTRFVKLRDAAVAFFCLYFADRPILIAVCPATAALSKGISYPHLKGKKIRTIFFENSGLWPERLAHSLPFQLP